MLVVDRMLPGKDGLILISELRAAGGAVDLEDNDPGLLVVISLP